MSQLSKISKSLLLLTAIVVLFSCKKEKKSDNDPGGSTDAPSTISTMLNNADGAALKYQEALQAGKDSIDAILEMTKWLIQQPEVAKAYFIGLDVIEVHYKNGMRNMISVMSTDANGVPRWRGGGGDDQGDGKKGGLLLTNNSRTTADDYIINNKRVLIFSPFHSSLYPSGYSLSRFTGSKITLEPNLVANSDATLGVVNSFKDYGFIIINSHGLPEGFEIKSKVEEFNVPHPPGSTVFTPDLIKSMYTDANGLPLEKFENGELLVTIKIIRADNTSTVFKAISTIVTDKYIRNMPHLDNAIVFANYCYSGYSLDGPGDRNIGEAFKSIGAATYYGYAFPDGGSAKVELKFAIWAEDTLINSLVKQGDSTGVAHLTDNITMMGDKTFERFNPKFEATADLTRETLTFKAVPPGPDETLLFSHLFDPRYKYGCGTFTDQRDGEVYQLVCAGGKRWFAENLRYNAPGSTTVDSSLDNLKEYGRLYNYPTAAGGLATCDPNQPGNIRGVCPEGWHVANHYDFFKLKEHIEHSNTTELSTMLKAASSLWAGDPQLNDPKRNSSGFNAYPTGYAYKNTWPAENILYLMGTISKFWLSSALSQTAGNAGYVNIYGESGSTGITWDSEMYPNDLDRNYLPCRCVEN